MSWSKRQTRLAKLSKEELRRRLCAIMDDPSSRRASKGSIHIFTRQAEQKMSDLVWAVTAKLEEERCAAPKTD